MLNVIQHGADDIDADRFEFDLTKFLSCFPSEHEREIAKTRRQPLLSPSPGRGLTTWKQMGTSRRKNVRWVESEAIRAQIEQKMDRRLGRRTLADVGSCFLSWASRTSTSESVAIVLKEYAANVGVAENKDKERPAREARDVEGLEYIAKLSMDITPTSMDVSRVVTSAKIN